MVNRGLVNLSWLWSSEGTAPMFAMTDCLIALVVEKNGWVR
jgi:hypothetical protein